MQLQALLFAHGVQRGQGLAERTIHREQKTVSAVLFFRGISHGAQGIVFNIQLGRRNNVITQVIRDMGSTLNRIHKFRIHKI